MTGAAESDVVVQPPPPPPPLLISSTSPYFLGPQDRPGDFITPTRLTADNYDHWASDVQMALEARRKWVFLDGTITTPSPPCTSSDWSTIQAMLISWIMNTISPEIKGTLSKYRDAKKLWDSLKSRFAMANGPRIHQLKSSLARCQQTKSMTIASYFGKLTVLWEELNNHEPLIECTCCSSCSAGQLHEVRRDTGKLHEFLMGLDSDYYSTVRSNILSQDPLPTLDRAYQLLVQAERVRLAQTTPDDTHGVVGFALRTAPRGGAAAASQSRPRVREDKSHLHCSHCKKTGHDIGTCFEIHGYPAWWEDRKAGAAASRGSSRPSAPLPARPREPVRANATAVAAASGSGVVLGAAAPPSSLFTADQWQALAGLLGNNKISDDRLNGMFPSTDWIVDTGASNHVTGNASLLFDLMCIPGCPVGLPNGAIVMAKQEGSVRLSDAITLTHVLYVPHLQCNLLSVSQLTATMNCIVQFNNNVCVIQDPLRNLIGTAVRRNGLYYFGGGKLVLHVSVGEATTSLELWHHRMGHPSEKIVKLLSPARHLQGSLNKGCEVCFRAKHPRSKFLISDHKASRIFGKVHCDLWGPYKHVSSCGAKYFLTLVDDYSRAVWVYLLIDKTEVFTMFMAFIAMIHRQFSQTIQVVQSDNGTEFNCLKDYFTANGILFQTSCVNTPQQNGRVERKHQHILNVGRALLFHANLPIYFWGESILTAAHLINRTPTPLLHNKTPYELLFNRPPSYDAIKVFGSLCFAYNHRSKGDKFDSRSRKCMFVGYPLGKKGWKLFDLDRKEFFVSRDVKFFEETFPFCDPEAANIDPHTLVTHYDYIHLDFDDFPSPLPTQTHPTANPSHISSPTNTPPIPPLSPITNSPLLNPPSTTTGLLSPTGPHVQPIPSPSNSPSPSLHSPSSAQLNSPQLPSAPTTPKHNTTQPTSPIPSTAGPLSVPSSTSPPTGPSTSPTAGPPDSSSSVSSADNTHLGRGLRARTPSVLLRDYVTNSVIVKSPSSPSSAPLHSSGKSYPIAHYINCQSFSENYRKFIANVTSITEPKSFKEAMQDASWRKSMNDEIRALEDNGTWTMELLPPGKRALGSQWVYRNKFDSAGNLDRQKSRLVVLGNHQKEGIDYTETFAPVAKMVTVRAFLAIAAAKNWELHQMDVHNAFLHGDLEEEVYMKLPPGFTSSQPNMVCRLRKSLYGLKQAPRCWFAKLVSALKGYGFLQSYSDYSLFTFTKGSVQINVLVYVDDLIVAGNDSSALKAFKAYLCACFKMKDLGPLKYFLGIEVARSASGIFLCQRKYTLDIISEAGLLGSKPVGFPIEQNHHLGLATGSLLDDPEPYRRLAGRLIYLAVTCPDLAYSVHILSQFMQAPRTDHWDAALRVVRYLKGTPGQGILLRADSDLTLTGWCDSDWAACPLTDRLSYTRQR